MKIQVPDIPPEGAVMEINAPAHLFPELKQLEADGEYRFVRDIHGRLEMRKVMDIVEIRGNIELKTRAACGRCLVDYDASIVHAFAVDFTPEPIEPDPEEAEIALGEADIGIIHYRGNTIDLREAIQEQVILALPLRPLCREGCKGLCHSCGENLNEGDCRCLEKSAIDPRFAVLKTLSLGAETK